MGADSLRRPMNVEKIYQFHRDEAFAKQFTDPSYNTFVAMPFQDSDRYPADRIYNLLRESVHACANERGRDEGLEKQFNPLTRISEGTGTATVITDSIVGRILRDHFLLET